MSKIYNRVVLIIALFFVMMMPGYAGNERDNSNVIIFVSFSMPKESIKGWMNEASRINAPVVIRGLINNSFKDTLKVMNELMSDNKGGLQLDPMLFRQFQINKVPAVVVREINKFDVIYGDSHLDYTLQMVINRKSSLATIAQDALEKLRSKQHA